MRVRDFMNECCKTTYRRTVSDIITLIKIKEIESIERLLKVLQFVLEELDDKKEIK